MTRDQKMRFCMLQGGTHLAYPGKASRGEAAAPAAISCLILFTSHQDNVMHFIHQIALAYKGGRELGKSFPTLILERVMLFFLIVKSLIDVAYILRTGHKSEVYMKFHAHNAPCTHHSTRKKTVCTQKRFLHLPGAPSISMQTLAPYAGSVCRVCIH